MTPRRHRAPRDLARLHEYAWRRYLATGRPLWRNAQRLVWRAWENSARRCNKPGPGCR